MTVTHEDLPGLWTRSLIAWPDGRRDVSTRVAWLQGTSLYIDLRQPVARPDFSAVKGLRDLTQPQIAWLATQEGFAGILEREDQYFVWRREIDFQPQALYSDAGTLRFEADYMVEEGRDVAYIEHWHRDAARPTAPRWGARLSDAESGRTGMILSVGALFMIAVSRTRTLPPQLHLSECVALAGGLEMAQDLVDCELSLGRVTAAGWIIERSSLPWREGAAVSLSARDGRLELAVSGSEPRLWTIVNVEGAPDLRNAG